MKKIVLAVFMAAMALSLSAQINFREGGFAEALEAAKSENKLVFMDCYTSWCGPCKLMASKEFVQEKAGEYFNPRFVSVKIDMEKGEGVASEESFKLMSEKYENGKANAVEYNEAKQNLMKAQSDELQAKYEYLFRTKILDFYKGEPIE